MTIRAKIARHASYVVRPIASVYQWRVQLTLGAAAAWTLSTGEERGCWMGRCFRNSLKVLKVEVKIIFYCVLAIFLLKLCLNLIASQASEEKNEIKISFWASANVYKSFYKSYNVLD